MATHSQASEELGQYLTAPGSNGMNSLLVPEGAYKGWLPRNLYSYSLDSLCLPFLRLLSFPVGGTALGSLTSLRSFHAVGNYLTRLPACFVECSNIVSLDLSFNHFTEIPQPIFSLSKLEELNFSHNDVEEVPTHIGQLVSLRVLNLAGNLLSYMPLEIAKCRRIQLLDLSGKFYPRGQMKRFPEGVCYLFELTELDLSWQQIENIPDEFGNLKRLQKLNLKGNHLLHVSAEIAKCVKLEHVNLAGALRLRSAIPEALFSFADLQSLNLSDNFFTEIPEEVFGLCRLNTLIVQRNALLRLPDSLFSLRHLHHLELSENYLEKLPPSIKNLRRLTFLGLDRNRLKELPDEICQVKSLVYLLLGSNQLTSLPENIYQLSSLSELALENNKLTELPLLMDRIEKLVETGALSLHNNYLRTPPQEICDQGVVPLFHFLKELRVSEAQHRRKMILIGAVKAGKTSLRHALMTGHSHLTAEHERTWVLERHLWEPESKLRVQILDFGGHQIYQAAHHMFLTPDALHLLVFDLSRFRTNLYDDLVSNWLDAIMDRAPGAAIVLIGTHADLCTKDEMTERCEDVVRRIQKEEAAKLAELRLEIERAQALLERPEAKESMGGKFGDIGFDRLQENLVHLVKTLNTRSKVPDKVYVVSCAESLDGVEDLRENLLRILKGSEGRSLPHSWYKFLSDIQAVPERILTIEKALNIFTDVMTSVNQSMIGIGGSARLSLSMILTYLHTTGEIVWFYDNPKLKSIVFHRPETLIEMLRTVFRHDFEKVVTFDADLARKVGFTEQMFEMLKEDFVHRGIMTYELLHFALLQFQLSSDALETFISLMLKFDLCYEVTIENNPSYVGSKHILQFPWFFPSLKPEMIAKDWSEHIPTNSFELRFDVEFSRKGPPYFFEKLSVRLQSFVTNRINWKHGVLARKNRSQLLVVRERKEAQDMTVVTVAARGSADLQELWWLLKHTHSEILQLMKEWPFAQYTTSLICTHCLLRKFDDPYRYPGEVMDLPMPKGMYIARWCRKHENDEVPVCFVYPLDMDYQDDLQKHMTAATDFLHSCMDVVDGELGSGFVGLLTNSGLAFIAARLGFEWTLVALQLGLRQERVEQIQMSFPTNAYLQIFNALQIWRDEDVRTNLSPAGDSTTDENASPVLDDKKSKTEKLLKVLKSDGIEKFGLAQEISEKFHLNES